MVVQTAREAIANANAYSTCTPGLCLKYTRTWLEIPSRYPDAATSYAQAEKKHPGDANPPAGFPCMWYGGSKGYGHIALSVGGGKCRSTDVPNGGRVGTVEIDWITRYWGQKYQGWTEDLNGMLLPYAAREVESEFAKGKIYVEKLKFKQLQSDSVGRLRYRLDNHSQIPAGRRPGPGVGYGVKVVNAVRYWQRNVGSKAPGPKDGTYLSNQQANLLFGPAYEVIEK